MVADTVDKPHYDQETERWRIDQFIKQGFDETQISIFLLDRVDHHDSERLLKKDCPHDLVVKILKGGDLTQ